MEATISNDGDRRLVRVGDWELVIPEGTEEPLIHDLDLAKRLGYKRPRDLRKLIQRMIEDGKITGVCRRAMVSRGGMFGKNENVDEYWLTKTQAYKVIAKSETKVADEMLDKIIEVFDAAMRGLLVPDTVRALEAKNLTLETRIAALESNLGGVIGDRLARRHVLDPLRECARLQCVADVDASKSKYMGALKDFETQVRMHVQFPAAGGQSWANLPIGRLGDAQCKVAELLHKVRKHAEPVLKMAAQTDLFGSKRTNGNALS